MTPAIAIPTRESLRMSDRRVLAVYEAHRGMKSPTHREIALSLGVSTSLVRKCSARLLELGFLRFREGKKHWERRALEATDGTPCKCPTCGISVDIDLTSALSELIAEYRTAGDDYAASRLETVLKKHAP